MNRREDASPEDLRALVESLQMEITRHVRVEQDLGRAQSRLDQQVVRHMAMQRYNHRALAISTTKDLACCSVEALIEVFEFECAALYEHDADTQELVRLAAFGAAKRLPLRVSRGSGFLKPHNARLLSPEDMMMDAWKDADLVQALVCPFGDIHGPVAGLAIAGRTRGRAEIYPEIRTELIATFALMVQQIDAVWTHQRLHSNLRDALEEVEGYKRRLEAENVYLREEVADVRGFANIIGQSPALRHVLHQVEQVAASDASVLILGESGTGKELVARAVHDASHRSERPIVKLNCAAIPANLIESELFGHTKGAFTGATQGRVGRFELADSGTLFLDEVGELPLEAQAKLLRVLQEGEVERVGEAETIHVDVRIVAATNRDLEREVAAGRFREDLFYRLNVFPIESPPLRERREDIAPLTRHFVKRCAARMGKSIETISERSIRRLEAYPWPGNVRELQNVIERAVILCSGSRLVVDAFPEVTRSRTPAVASVIPGVPRPLRAMEVELIREALHACGGVIGGKKGAARWLDMPASTLRERIERYGIERC